MNQFVEVYVRGGSRHVASPRAKVQGGTYSSAVCGVFGPLDPTTGQESVLFWKLYGKCKRCQKWMSVRTWSWPTKEPRA